MLQFINESWLKTENSEGVSSSHIFSRGSRAVLNEKLQHCFSFNQYDDKLACLHIKVTFKVDSVKHEIYCLVCINNEN